MLGDGNELTVYVRKLKPCPSATRLRRTGRLLPGQNKKVGKRKAQSSFYLHILPHAGTLSPD